MENEIRLIEEFISAYINGSIKPSAPPVLVEAVEYSVYGAGKRLRPLLSLYTAEAIGISSEQISRHVLPGACAIECIHNYSLVHDDLPCMDNDVMRRGKPTTHIKFGEAIALLAGDALLNLAFEILADNAVPPAACSIIARAAGSAGMIGGQVLDIDPAEKNQETMTIINRMKTGALFNASILFPATLKQLSPDNLAGLETFASAFGLAFQLVDDLNDDEVEASDWEFTRKRAASLLLESEKSIPGFLSGNPDNLMSIIRMVRDKIPV